MSATRFQLIKLYLRTAITYAKAIIVHSIYIRGEFKYRFSQSRRAASLKRVL